MATKTTYKLSVVVPLYNEARGLAAFHDSLVTVLDALQGSYELIYCDDGSTDGTPALIKPWHRDQPSVKLIVLSRNFGKENALTAGIAQATGDAILTLDGDGQHPVELIPRFVARWQDGAKVVVGLRQNDSGDGLFKRAGSHLFYRLINKLTGQKLMAGSTDFRLIDKTVQTEFLRLQETDRLTRGLIDWLGFSPVYLAFTSKARQQGSPNYSHRMLVRLATNSIVSMTSLPLYLFGYLGVGISGLAFLLGSAVFIEQLILDDPWHWNFTGTAMLAIILVFLVGLVLMSQGILSLYVSHIHNQSKQRPLYIIDHDNSIGFARLEHE